MQFRLLKMLIKIDEFWLYQKTFSPLVVFIFVNNLTLIIYNSRSTLQSVTL